MISSNYTIENRAVQHLLGRENLSTTQVYLSITDKNIREAVYLLDEDKNIHDQNKNMINLSQTQNKSIMIKNDNRPLLLIREVDNPDEIDKTIVTAGGYFSHFEIWNEGKTSSSEITISLMDKNKEDWH